MKVQTRSAVLRCGAYAFTIYSQVKGGRKPEISIEGYTEEGKGRQSGRTFRTDTNFNIIVAQGMLTAHRHATKRAL